MSADNCWKIFQDKLKQVGDVIDDSYRARLENDYDTLQKQLANINRQLEDIDPDTGKTYLDGFLENISVVRNQKNLDAMAGEITARKNQKEIKTQVVDTYNNLKIIYKGTKKSDNQFIQDAITAHIYNTNFTYNTNPLELLVRNKGQIIHANFIRQVSDILGSDENGLFRWMKQTKQNEIDFMREYNNIINDLGNRSPKAITGNTQARDIAKAFVDNAIIDPTVRMDPELGIVKSITRNRMKIRLAPSKVLKTKEQDFVNDFAERLDEKTHGDIDTRKQLSKDIYQSISNGDDWRDIDNLIRNYDNVDGQVGKSLTYRDGEDILEISKKYSADQDPLTLMLSTITENSRLLALHEKFGPNFKTEIQKLEIWARSQVKGRPNETFKSAMNFLQEIANPQIKENFGTAARTLTSLRAVQAGARLGGAVITSLMDMPVVLWAGRNIFKLPAAELIASIFRVPVYKNLDKTKVRNYQLMTHDFAQAWMANSGERFGMIDMGGAMSKVERGSFNFATRIFKYSGLNWWTESLQKSTGTVYQKYLGRLIKEKKAWFDLDPDFRAQFEKFGIQKTEWDQMLNTREIVDSDDALNLYALKDELSTSKGLQSKMISVIRDAVDTMVIKPSEFDKAAGRFFQADDGGFVSQFVKLLTQFKTHPITYTRKVVWRKFLRNRAVKDENGQLVEALDKIEKIWPAVTLAGSMITMGVVVAQVKEVIKGRSPLTDPGELAYRSLQQSGVLGLMSDLFVVLAEPAIKQLSTDKKVRTKTGTEIMREFVGPVIGDAMKLMSNIAGAGAGTSRFATGVDDGEFLKKEMTKFTKHMFGYSGLQTLWYTKALYRALITEYLTEVLDYKTYLRTQKRLKRDAREKRLGDELNIIDLFN